MLASVASAAMIHKTATTMNPGEFFGVPMVLKRAMSAHFNIVGLPCRRHNNARTLGRRRPRAERRYLGVNERTRRHCERAGGGCVPHAHANGTRKLLCPAPGFPPDMIGSGVGKRNAIGCTDHDDEICKAELVGGAHARGERNEWRGHSHQREPA